MHFSICQRERFEADDASLTGLAWAASICVVDPLNNPSSFQLSTEVGNTTVVEKANNLWGWQERFNYPGYGRMVRERFVEQASTHLNAGRTF